ncbi:enoyl-CoA hydratase/isomerase family protein [Nitratireductor sp. ZSWI3]|uniref:enoyl-CoA hydratase/isomerase family protein n=1 Tax=Nitratireductor sp. ZSWI3 TaxID=2966359 RepID=UPI00214F745F|nr:enoyl-CoA hydratase/isomerase family protein [Nitratireductor sp. ZSWI3]MCR4268116.1 enoyl-CoA hydratase/isomerase family protein [Nitratireductor sp. ZSWI3]
MDFGGADDILFETRGPAGLVTLNRPSALNAVNHRMVQALARALAAWEADDAVRHVVIRGEGRAFSAGGDILDVYEGGRAGNPPVGFFADEYRLNAAIARFPKPYVALIDGIVMGGGVGVSFHGSHRVMTEKAQFAMPEVGIGFFPDVGGSHLLSRLPGEFGMYLALTGGRIRWGDACGVGLATHTVEAEKLAALLDALCATDNVGAAIASHATDVEGETDDACLHAIAHHFSSDALDDMLDSLALAQDDWLREVYAKILTRSPTSLCVAFRQLRAGAMLSMDECMRMEYRILRRMLAGHDFYEGIRAAIIEKDSAPKWRPAALSEVLPQEIEAYFAPLPEGDLVL